MRRAPSSVVLFGLPAAILVALALSVPASGGPGAPGSPDVSTPSGTATAPALLESAGLPDLPGAGLNGETCESDSSVETLTESAAKPRFRTCRCSCGAPCRTDADCGGAPGSCRQGVTCC